MWQKFFFVNAPLCWKVSNQLNALCHTNSFLKQYEKNVIAQVIFLVTFLTYLSYQLSTMDICMQATCMLRYFCTKLKRTINKVENIKKKHFTSKFAFACAFGHNYLMENYTLLNLISPKKNPWWNTESTEESTEYCFLAVFLFFNENSHMQG